MAVDGGKRYRSGFDDRGASRALASPLSLRRSIRRCFLKPQYDRFCSRVIPTLNTSCSTAGARTIAPQSLRSMSRGCAIGRAAKTAAESDAINRGMQWGSGLWAAWINSDDALWRNALKNHVSAHPFRPDVVYAGICQHIDEAGEVVGTHQGRVNTLEDLVRIRQVWRSAGFIDQPAVLSPWSCSGLSAD